VIGRVGRTTIAKLVDPFLDHGRKISSRSKQLPLEVRRAMSKTRLSEEQGVSGSTRISSRRQKSVP
jgi:hypothetical protein